MKGWKNVFLCFVSLEQGWQTYSTFAQMWHALWSQLKFFFMSLTNHHLCIVKNMYTYIYIHISDGTEIVYELPLLPNVMRLKNSYTNVSSAKG
jgi:hypothetical protein